MQKIKIVNLGALHDIEFDIKQFNFFIGEQAVGKSTLCKAIYFCRLLKHNIIDALYKTSFEGGDFDKFNKNLKVANKDLFIKIFGYSWYLPENMKFYYTFGNNKITVSINKDRYNKKYFNISFNKNILENLAKIQKEYLNYYNSDEQLSILITHKQNLLRESIARSINNLFEDDMNTYYIPAGRSLLTLLTNQKTRLDYDGIDFINKEFMQMIEAYSRKFDGGLNLLHKYFPKDKRDFNTSEVSKKLVEQMKGEYFFGINKEYLKIDDDEVLINFISSGQQEALWLLNLLYIWLLKDEKAFVIIEEPEAHLYPTMQKNILDFIVYYMNITNSNIIVTTHSPYMLTNANLLYYAGKLKNNGKNISKITGKYKYINPADSNICKLKLEDNKTDIESLTNNNYDDIKMELIDDVSDIINETYTRLIDLEDENE